MSGLNIDHGGAISVDPQALREVAGRMDALVALYDEARSATDRAYGVIVETPGFSAHVDTVALWASGQRLATLRAECAEAVTGTLLMADVYEYVELQAEAEALAISDAAGAEALQLRIDRLAASDDRIPDMAAMLIADWEDDRFEGLGGQYSPGGALTPFFLGAGFLGANLGWGKVHPGMTLSGTADPVSLTPVKTSSPAASPASTADAFRRMPGTSGAQVAVEKYTMPDGTSTYVAYVVGTQNFNPLDAGDKEPWDMKSNVELYSGQTSASYQATLDALAAAGAQPGDQVDIVAHSQAGMIAAHLSMESEFDVQVQITAGSPVEPTLDADQTLIQYRHPDDAVSSLAGGGSPAGTGSPDSVTVTRQGDPLDGFQDVRLQTHFLENYIETAELAEASGDPRLEAMADHWADLNGAVEIERTEYRAERTG